MRPRLIVAGGTGTRQGRQETAFTSFHATLFHHAIFVVGLTCTFRPSLSMDEITGGTPCSAATLSASDGSRVPPRNEHGAARFRARHVATIASTLERAHQAAG